MSTIARSRFLSAFSVARRLVSDHAQVAQMGVRRGNAAYWRTLGYNVRTSHSVTQSTWVNKESQEMMAVWPDVIRDITDAARSLNIPDVPEWMIKLLQYNVPRGKKVRGLTFVYTYKSLVPSDQFTEENNRLVQILAWCVEMVQGYLLIIDDIQDRSLVRRGQPCWYLYNDINLAATNDGLMLESFVFYLIRKHFKGKDCYIDLVETFQDMILKVLIGQCLDMHSSNFGKKPNLDLFTLNRYNSLAKCKTAYYSFVLPVIAAMHFAGIKDPEMFRQATTITLEIGHFYQVQDDYLGSFGDIKTFGKNHTDIQEGKCTWLIVKALQHATPEQRKILEECYGYSDLEKVNRVKQLFIDLDLPNAYCIYEEETYNLLHVQIQQISDRLSNNLFSNLLRKIYHRMS